MGASDQPYIYEPSSQRRVAYPYSDFNPKAVTQASYQALQEKDKNKAKQDGPLINFNAHPDSYMIVAGQNVNYKPLPANTKKSVTIIRWMQFGLRIHQEIAALGLLVCVICIKGMETSLSWIMRIAPAWDSVITLYAIYHLIRPAKARTPASSASYHMFALFMDAGLIPFYVFIAIFANNNYLEAPGTQDRWTSFFTTPGSTTMLLLITFIGAATIAALHFVSCALDLALVILFRKISKLPPDMNPLEDNLTSGGPRASKHKHKNSELTLVDSLTERKPGYLSGSTISDGDRSRLSTADKDTREPTIPFGHSRMGSDTTFSPHNPETARLSRQNIDAVDMYQQPRSARSSRTDVYRHSRGQSMTPSKLGSYVETNDQLAPPPRSSDRLNSMRPTSYPDSRTGTNLTNPPRFSSPALPNAAPSNALVKTQQNQGLLDSNWYTLEDYTNGMDTPSRGTTPNPEVKLNGHQIERHDSFEPQPLKMHPPTPPPKNYSYPDPDDEPLSVKRAALTERRDYGNADINRSLTVQSNMTTTSSVYSESSPELTKGNTTPKGKYYGDLAAATRGVRGMKSNDTISTYKSTATVDAAVMDSTGMFAMGGYGYAPDPPPKKPKNVSPTKTKEGKGRVVSRSGADVGDPSAMYPVGMRDRREVSGKVAEEGRGGGGWWNRGRY